MPDLREVFEMTTKQMGEPDVDSRREQEKRQRNASRNKKLGVFAVAAAIAVVAVAVIVGTWGGQDTTTPANPPTTVEPSEETAEDVATDFFNAYSFSNEDQAVSMLAETPTSRDSVWTEPESSDC
jgi:NADH:ubiquinone oxidoreductase subunit 6 (subunit J)